VKPALGTGEICKTNLALFYCLFFGRARHQPYKNNPYESVGAASYAEPYEKEEKLCHAFSQFVVPDVKDLLAYSEMVRKKYSRIS